MKTKSTIKKLVTLITAFVMIITSTIVYQPQSVEAAAKNRIELEKKYTSLYVGESYTLKAKDIYQNGQKVTSTDSSKLSWKYFKFTSSKKSVATVSKKGVVTAKKKGSTTITMTSIYNSKVKATVKLKVKAKAKKTKIEMVSKKATVFVGDATTLKVKKVTGLSGKEVKFSSSDKKIATVNSNGVVVGKKVGTATITVTSVLNKKAKTTVKVTVTTEDMENTIYNPAGEAKIVLVEDEVTLAPESSFSTDWFDGQTGYYKSYGEFVNPGASTWAEFFENQKKSYGQAQIKVKSITGVSSSAVSYTSSDSTIAEVSSTGFVTPKRAGLALITVTSKANSNIKATYKVVVRNLVTAVDVYTYCELRFEENRSVRWFDASAVLPKNADNRKVLVTSDNENVIKIRRNEYGACFLDLTGKGKANLTIQSEDGFFKATWVMKVSDIEFDISYT